MVFLKIILSFVSRFRNYDTFKFFFENFLEFLKTKKNTVYNPENIEDFRKVQTADLLQNSSSFFEAVQFKDICHTILHPAFEDLKPMLKSKSLTFSLV